MAYDFTANEEAMLAFWEKHDIYAKARAQATGEDFYFLDGPPYTSGKVHLGTAWNKALKDMVLRYKRMRGYKVWDRAGYDMHGLPTEHAAQKKLGLTTKEDIERYGVDAFITACKQLCIENMELMNKDFLRLGVWMDFANAYQSIKDSFIEGVWWLVKRAYDDGRLYEGLKTMTWCPRCASALAKHECEYRTVNEPSIFVKFAVDGKENEYLIIWTTTPWTIPFNLAVMVNPELPYVRAKVTVNGTTETWVLAKALVGPVVQAVADGSFTIEEEFPGTQLEGLRYHHPFERHLCDYERMRQDAPKLHTVILSSEYVDTSAGSGLVHCAPGCGPEDFEVGRRNGLPPYNTLDETGRFPESMGPFAGKIAKEDDEFFIQALRDEGALIATVDVEHEYPHCWRHHTPVIFRATQQWFFKVEDIKEQLIAQNDKIRWVPRAAYNAFDSWLRNLRDNSVTKQRYWGTAFPVWRCDQCGHTVVIGSKEELKQYAGTLPPDLHKPWIDEVTWQCPHCTASPRGVMRRIPDILDVWVDAGTVSWNCLDHPHRDDLLKRLFPADFILEGKDQIRGWFNLLHVCSNLAFKQPCFTTCYMHGFINDAQGRKMSKSLGNYILPEEVVKKYGASTFRYYVTGAANPGLDMNYNFEDVELKHRNLLVYWNLLQFLLGQRRNTDFAPLDTLGDALGIEERYILSRLHSTLRAVTESMEQYRLNEVPAQLEQLLLDLSRQYIQLVREKAAHGTTEEKAVVLATAFTVFYDAMRAFSIVIPLFTEHVHQELRDAFKLSAESIHLAGWPTHDESYIDTKLEDAVSAAFDVISAGLAARDAAQLGVRWPAAELVIETKDEQTRTAVRELEELIKRQVNVKRLVLRDFTEAATTVKPNYKALGKDFGSTTADIINALKDGLPEDYQPGTPLTLGQFTLAPEHLIIERHAPDGWSLGSFPKGTVFLSTTLTPELEREGFARELIRRGQQLRKQTGLERGDAAQLNITGEVDDVLAAHGEEIAKRCGAELVTHELPGARSVTASIRGRDVTLQLKKR